MSKVLEIVRYGNAITLLAVAIFLWVTVRNIISDSREIHVWGILVGIGSGIVLFVVVFSESLGADELLAIGIRSAAAGCIAMSVTWFCLLALRMAYHRTIRPVISSIRNAFHRFNISRERRRERIASQKAAREADERMRREKPERDRRAQEEARKKQEAALEVVAAQNRRMEARSRCELLFTLHEADIRARFNRDALNAYMQKYMSDTEPAATVERRGVELQALIEKHCATVGISNQPKSIDELARWFIDEKSRIESLPLDERMRATHLAHLNMRYAELSQEILEKIRP